MGDDEQNDLHDYANELLKELDRVFQEGIDKDMSTSLTAPYDISVDGSYSNNAVISTVAPAVMPLSMETALGFASSNLLQVVEKNNIETSIGIIGEDEFKKRTKTVLGEALGKEVAKKAKFTILKDPHTETVQTRARVYVFTDADLRIFIEKLMSYR